MPQLSLHLLGTFEGSLDATPITDFESDKERALLIYLATESDRSQHREMLAGLLWPDMADRDARTNLRQSKRLPTGRTCFHQLYCHAVHPPTRRPVGMQGVRCALGGSDTVI